jgi:hypothetical protein
LYGCETWSLTLREEYRLRVFEERMPGRMYGSKRIEVTRDWTKLHEFHNLHYTKYYYNHYSKKDQIGGGCGTYGRDQKFVQKCHWERTGEETWENTIKIDLKEL